MRLISAVSGVQIPAPPSSLASFIHSAEQVTKQWVLEARFFLKATAAQNHYDFKTSLVAILAVLITGPSLLQDVLSGPDILGFAHEPSARSVASEIMLDLIL
jgi:hypothetical protein